MNGITSRCISFAQGNQDCLQRVNYEFGLVLGVDEFVDEQCYFLEKEYQHNRSLHGYGTVSGLLVSAAENGDDIEVQVDTGIGIDQYGRVFVVRNKQCASLLSWLDEQGLDSGDQTIYVVARYDECETALVPIAGQPCSSSDQLTAPSRIQDNFSIELTLDPPEHPARDAVVNLAEFLSRFRVDPDAPDIGDLGSASSLAPIIGPTVIADDPAAFISHIDDQVELITGTAGATIITIQPQIVESLLNDIFVYWITEVRPTLDPDLIDPDAPETADGEPFPAVILLAQLDLTIPDDGDLELDDITIDNTTRPYLLHTQLIQELFDIPDLAGEGGEAPPQKEVAEFATIEDVSPRILSLWIHIGENLDLQPNENVRLLRVGPRGDLEQITIDLTEDVRRRNEVGRYYRIRTFENLENGDFLLLRFDTDQIRVGDDRPQTLSEFIADAPFTYENYMPRQARLYAYHVVERSETISEEEIRRLIIQLLPEQEPVIPFVTITPIVPQGDILDGYELWFHLDGVAENNDGGIGILDPGNMAMYVETAPGVVDEVPLGENDIQMIRPNVWMVTPLLDDEIIPPLVRFVFSLQVPMDIWAYDPNNGNRVNFDTLQEYIEETGQRLEGEIMTTGRFEDGDALVVYVREQSAARRLRTDG